MQNFRALGAPPPDPPNSPPHCEFLAARLGAVVFHDLLIAAGGSCSNSVEVYIAALEEKKIISSMNRTKFATSLVHFDGYMYTVCGCANAWDMFTTSTAVSKNYLI